MDAADGKGGGLKVLLVEDHSDSARAMARLLTTCGHQVDVAHGVKEGLKMAGGHGFDLLISDLALPDGSGLDLMRQLRGTRSTLKGIALRGFTQSTDVEESISAGFQAHVAKPVDFHKLRQVIEQVIAAPGR